MQAMLQTFGDVFSELDTYTGRYSGDGYQTDLLTSDYFVALVVLYGEDVVGGIATALVERLKHIAVERGAYVLLVQADISPEDAAAITLYNKLEQRKAVLHFDIPVSDH